MSDEKTIAAGVPLWLAIVSLVTMFLSTSMLLYALWQGTSYAFLLICLFLLFVATMHCGLCFWRRITKRHIRYGEYTYLLLAIVGVLLASASAGGDRLQLILTAKAQIQISESGVSNIVALNERVCDGELYQWYSHRTGWFGRVGMEWLIRRMYVPSKEFCAWNADVSRLLRSSQPSRGEWAEIIGNGYKVAHEHRWYNFNPVSNEFIY